MMKLKQEVDIVLKKSTSNRGRLSGNSWQWIMFQNITFDKDFDMAAIQQLQNLCDNAKSEDLDNV